MWLRLSLMNNVTLIGYIIMIISLECNRHNNYIIYRKYDTYFFYHIQELNHLMKRWSSMFLWPDWSQPQWCPDLHLMVDTVTRWLSSPAGLVWWHVFGRIEPSNCGLRIQTNQSAKNSNRKWWSNGWWWWVTRGKTLLVRHPSKRREDAGERLSSTAVTSWRSQQKRKTLTIKTERMSIKMPHHQMTRQEPRVRNKKRK